MEIRAYDVEYLRLAQRVLGDALDYAVYSCEMEADQFFGMFLVSGIAEQFGKGNPLYIAGMTGCELVRKVILKSGMKVLDIPDAMYLDKSPEYWAGWSLAYYQWYTGRSFLRIHRAVSIQEILYLYPALHEADLMKFVEIMDEKLQQYYRETNLKQIRNLVGLSQNELAENSGIPLRQIQRLEQGEADIYGIQVIDLYRLSKALGCRCEDLLET